MSRGQERHEERPESALDGAVRRGSRPAQGVRLGRSRDLDPLRNLHWRRRSRPSAHGGLALWHRGSGPRERVAHWSHPGAASTGTFCGGWRSLWRGRPASARVWGSRFLRSESRDSNPTGHGVRQRMRIRTSSVSMRASSTVHSPGSTSSSCFSTLRATRRSPLPSR
jgi:hypothetical protein